MEFVKKRENIKQIELRSSAGSELKIRNSD